MRLANGRRPAELEISFRRPKTQHVPLQEPEQQAVWIHMFRSTGKISSRAGHKAQSTLVATYATIFASMPAASDSDTPPFFPNKGSTRSRLLFGTLTCTRTKWLCSRMHRKTMPRSPSPSKRLGIKNAFSPCAQAPRPQRMRSPICSSSTSSPRC